MTCQTLVTSIRTDDHRQLQCATPDNTTGNPVDSQVPAFEFYCYLYPCHFYLEFHFVNIFVQFAISMKEAAKKNDALLWLGFNKRNL